MRILWHSVPPMFKTGYGTQTAIWTRRLKREHDVAISSIICGMPSYVNPDGIEVFSAGPRHCFGNDFIRAHCKHFKPDIVLSLSDTFVYDEKKVSELPWVGWQIIDSTPFMPRLVKPARAMKHLLALTRFGQRVMKEAGFDSTHIPHGLDLHNEWYIGDPLRARDTLSKWWELPIDEKRVLIIMNAANMSRPSRKNFFAALSAFKMMLAKYPDALLYIHTESTGQMQGGENILEHMRALDISFANVIFPSQYKYMMGMFESDYLRTIYQASDACLFTSCGEGFGLPIIEAYGCGCRVIAPGYSAMAELVAEDDQIKQGVMFAHTAGSQQFMVDPAAVGERLCALRETSKPMDYYRKLAEPYDIDRVISEHFNPFLQRIKGGEICLSNPAPESKPSEPAQSVLPESFPTCPPQQ